MHTITRKWSRTLVRLLIFTLLLTSLAGPAMPVPGGAPAAGATTAYAAKVDTAVWKALAESPDGTAEAIVYMDAQADLSFAESMDDWDARGWAVYDALRATADASQARVVDTLARQQTEGHVTRYRSYWIVNVLIMRGDRDGLLAVAALPEVAQVLPPLEIERPDPEAEADAVAPDAVEWGIARINADDVWTTYGITGTGAVVANVDTGVEYTHPALVNQYRGNLGGSFDHNYNWWDLYGTVVPNDDDSHGTHTMGTMIGWDGAANQIGVAPGAKWIAALGCCPDNEALFSAEQWIIAPTRLDGSGADPTKRPDVSNNSWGGPGGSMMFDKLNAAQRAAGVFPSYSAGNNGSACGTSGAPGDGPSVFNVGNTTSTDAISSSSSRGPDPFSNDVSPQVSAPGSNIRSSVPGNGYANFSGTSMAAPHVAGSVALLISLEPKLRGQIGQLEELLRKTADPKTTASQTCGGVPGTQVPNNTFGWGRINVKGAADLIYHAGWLSGTVTAGGNPVAGVEITFSKPAYTYTLTTRTDMGGHYKVLAGAGTWNMTAGGYGYQTATVNGLVVTQDTATVQDFALTALPTYTVSGVVRDATSAGVAAYLEIANQDLADPAWAASNGAYSLVVPQGTYSLTVSHPGFQPQTLNLNVAGNQALDISLTARLNYTCLDSRDPGGPTYDWIEASDGTPHNMGDENVFTLALPTAFSYFGADRTSMRVSSNGFVGFGAAYSSAGLIVPFEGSPNNIILAFNDDLNPENGTQGIVYHKFVDTKVIIQWEAVQHWASGYPETFQVILDTADDSVLVQYKVMSLPDIASGGLEDNTGTVGQLWNYSNSAGLVGGLAVMYAPAVGNNVNWGCDHQLWMTYSSDLAVMPNQPDTPVKFSTGGHIIGQFGAPSVVTTLTVPLGSTFVAASPGGVLSGNVVVWDRGNVRARAHGSVWIRVQPASWLPTGTPLQSKAVFGDATGLLSADGAQTVLINPGPLPPNSVLVPIIMRNVAP
jgi:subtilisin family serine protease